MQTICDTRLCPYCNRNYDWEYYIPVRSTSTVFIERYDSNKSHPKPTTREPVNNRLHFKARCKLCDKLERFTYNVSTNSYE